MTTTLCVVSLLSLLLWSEVGGPPFRVSPDGQYYLGPTPPRPYCLRPLLPWLFRRRVQWWVAVSWASILATALILGWRGGVGAAVLFLGLASTRTNVLFPILTDQLGILCVTVGLVLPWPWNLILSIIGTLVNEKVPIVLAALAGDPWLLSPLVISCWLYMRGQPPGDEEPAWLRTPFREARRSLQLTPQALLFPWGVAALGLWWMSPWALLAGYLPLLTAQDRARLYQWIAPGVCLAAAPWIPVPLLIVHWLNPWRSTL
jgi:hypothetical protein